MGTCPTQSDSASGGVLTVAAAGVPAVTAIAAATSSAAGGLQRAAASHWTPLTFTDYHSVDADPPVEQPATVTAQRPFEVAEHPAATERSIAEPSNDCIEVPVESWSVGE